MSSEKRLGDIARDVFYKTDGSASYVFNKVASAVEKEVLLRLNAEPVAGQELTFVQVAQWVEKYGSTKGLEVLQLNCGVWSMSLGVKDPSTKTKYRVATKKSKRP